MVRYVSNADYDDLGRRETTETAAGTRTFTYDGSLPRLLQDRFDGSSDPYFFERNYGGVNGQDFDGLGNVTTITGTSLPGDIDLDETFQYDTRNRIDG